MGGETHTAPGSEAQARLLTYADIAGLSGMRPKVLRAYASQGRLPAPDETVNGRPHWRSTTVQAWLDQRAARAFAVEGSSRLRTLDGAESLRYKDIAALTGLGIFVLRTYLYRGTMPAPDAIEAGQPRWRPATIQAWLDEREARVAARQSPKPPPVPRENPISERSRAAAIAALEPTRAQLLRALRSGTQLGDAARAVGTSGARVLRRSRWDAEWRTDIDAALLAGRDPQLAHGTLTAYQRGCRCSDCRTVRRDYDQRYRGLPASDPSEAS